MLVGGHHDSEQHEFTVYLDTITKRSGFFRESENSRSDDPEPYVLHDYDPETFDKYLHCIYHNKVPEYIQPPLKDDERTTD